MRIGIFDSGVGGLSVLAAIRAKLPDEAFIYCCDNLNFPYGTKSDEEVVQYSTEVSLRFVRAAGLDLLVVACNTMSTVALQQIRQTVACPVIGVVPAVKPASAMSRSKVIGVLATPATVRRPYLDTLIRDFAADCTVLKAGSVVLVELAEGKMRGESVNLALIRQEMAPLFVEQSDGSRIDTVVLGCTHFPLLREELSQAAPWPVTWIDSGDAIAQRVVQLRSELNIPASADMPKSCSYATADADNLWRGEVPAFVQALGLTEWCVLP